MGDLSTNNTPLQTPHLPLSLSSLFSLQSPVFFPEFLTIQKKKKKKKKRLSPSSIFFYSIPPPPLGDTTPAILAGTKRTENSFGIWASAGGPELPARYARRARDVFTFYAQTLFFIKNTAAFFTMYPNFFLPAAPHVAPGFGTPS